MKAVGSLRGEEGRVALTSDWKRTLVFIPAKRGKKEPTTPSSRALSRMAVCWYQRVDRMV